MIWVGVRLAFMMLGGLAGAGIVLAPAVVPLFAGVVAAVALADLRVVRDDVFLANLGVGARHVAALAFIVALVPEAAITVGFAFLT